MIKKDRTSKFKIFSDDYFRTINQTGVRQRIGLCGIDYISCWDTRLSPEGVLYYAPPQTKQAVVGMQDLSPMTIRQILPKYASRRKMLHCRLRVNSQLQNFTSP